VIEVKGFDSSMTPHSTLRSGQTKGATQGDEDTTHPPRLGYDEEMGGEGGED